jgi:1-acyl-sn-glycerol-3-phosphate acyltransferase
LSLVHVLLYFVDILLVRVLWRTRIEGTFPLPIGTGGIVVCNHRSSIDPFFIQVLIPKAMHWLVAAEYFKAPGMGWFLRQTGAIPVKRGSVDTSATKLAIRRAQQGDLVGTGVPVVPCYIDGSPYDGKSVLSPFFMRAKVTVHIGKPIDLAEYRHRKGQDLHEELTLRFLKEIARLAGRPNYQPKLAHRDRARHNSDAEQVEEAAV